MYIYICVYIYIYIYAVQSIVFELLNTFNILCLLLLCVYYRYYYYYYQGALPAAPVGDGDALTAGRLVPGLLTAMNA